MTLQQSEYCLIKTEYILDCSSIIKIIEYRIDYRIILLEYYFNIYILRVIPFVYYLYSW
jgi:hypothetical protein